MSAGYAIYNFNDNYGCPVTFNNSYVRIRFYRKRDGKRAAKLLAKFEDWSLYSYQEVWLIEKQDFGRNDERLITLYNHYHNIET